MFDARSILGDLMQGGGMTGSSTGRLDRAARSTGQSDMLGGLLGGGQGGGMMGGGGLGGLLGSVLGGGSGGRGGMGGSALGGGMMGILVSLAGNALRQSSAAGQPPGPAPGQLAQRGGGLMEGRAGDVSSFDSPSAAGDDEERQAMLLLQAMMEAAKADGQVDQSERQRITSKLDEAGADAEAKQWVERELAQPANPGALASQVTSPELAAQVYTASILAIEVDTPAEQAYLRDLAGRLNLPRAALEHIHTQLGVDAPG